MWVQGGLLVADSLVKYIKLQTMLLKDVVMLFYVTDAHFIIFIFKIFLIQM